MTTTNSNPSYEERIASFLNELTKLSRFYGVDIDGCGCCGSPYLSDVSDKDLTNYKYTVTNGEDHLKFSKSNG